MFFNTDYTINNAIFDYGDFKKWLDFEKEIYEGYGYDFEFLGLRSIQINIEPTKASIGSYIDLPCDLRNSKSILNIGNSKCNCLQLTITAWLNPAMHHATRESKYVNKVIEPRQQHEDDFAYIIRIQKLYCSGYDFSLLCSELFKQKNDKRKADNIPLAAGKSKIFSIGCLKFSDSYNFLSMPLDQMSKIYGCKTKTLYPYEYFDVDDYQEVIGNLKIEDFKSSLSNKLPTQEEVYSFNKDNSHKTGKDLTIA